MKHLYLLAIACVAISLCSCKKEALSNTVLNSTSSGNTADDAFFRRQKQVNVKYGADIGSPTGSNDYSFQMGVANQLGVSCLREAVQVPNKNLNSDLVPELHTKYKILLNFTSPGKGKDTIPFRTDIKQYKQDLKNILNTFNTMPVVAAIENEESNLLFYKGSAMDYIKQLNAAIDVMQARNIKVTNGGLTSTGLNYLVIQDFFAQGKYDSAYLFEQQTQTFPDSSKAINRGMFIDTLLTHYATMPLAYINFHWRALTSDTLPLSQVINYIVKRTGKKVITNELSQIDFDTTTLVRYVQMCTNRAFDYIIWNSPDQNANKRETPLQYPDGTLTPTGITYKNYLASKK